MSLTPHPEHAKPGTTTTAPTIADYLTHWLADVVKPSREPATFAYYEAMVRLYIIPGLGSKPLDQLDTHDVQAWLNTLPTLCQCCHQGKDAARPPGKRRCCAIGACCYLRTGHRTIQAARNTLRTALSHAIATNELTSRNVASLAKPPRSRHRAARPTWTLDDAWQFLTSAHDDDDALYAAYVLVLVNALPTGKALGLTWSSLDLDQAELRPNWQLQRVGTDLIHKNRPSVSSPLPDISLTALKLRRAHQDAARDLAGDRWQPSDLVFTTRWGTPIEPRNFNRSFDTRCAKADVPPVPARATRRTCPAILADLAIHPDIATRILGRAKITAASDREA